MKKRKTAKTTFVFDAKIMQMLRDIASSERRSMAMILTILIEDRYAATLNGSKRRETSPTNGIQVIDQANKALLAGS